jgi:hypothetical protein
MPCQKDDIAPLPLNVPAPAIKETVAVAVVILYRSSQRPA